MISFALVFALLIGIVMPVQKVEAASSSFYLTSKFKCKKVKEKELSGIPTKLKIMLDPFNEKDTKFKIEIPIPHAYTVWSGKLKKNGKNKYICKKGKVIFRFKVYKNKVVLSQNRTSSNYFYNISGTYKGKPIML